MKMKMISCLVAGILLIGGSALAANSLPQGNTGLSIVRKTVVKRYAICPNVNQFCTWTASGEVVYAGTKLTAFCSPWYAMSSGGGYEITGVTDSPFGSFPIPNSNGWQVTWKNPPNALSGVEVRVYVQCFRIVKT